MSDNFFKTGGTLKINCNFCDSRYLESYVLVLHEKVLYELRHSFLNVTLILNDCIPMFILLFLSSEFMNCLNLNSIYTSIIISNIIFNLKYEY